jgi:hypothetical protein
VAIVLKYRYSMLIYYERSERLSFSYFDPTQFPWPFSAGSDSNTMFDGTEYDNKVPWQVPAIQYAVCDANPMSIVFASKECVGRRCAITQNTCSAW